MYDNKTAWVDRLENNEDQIAQIILDAIRNSKETRKYAEYGLRTDDREFKVGDYLPSSYDMGADHWDYTEEYELNGTCATGFGAFWDDEDDIDVVKEALDVQKMYRGQHLYLVGGGYSEYGNDIDEIILQDAEVVAVIM